MNREQVGWAVAVATALGGLLAWLIAAGAQLDGRLDRLEEDARVLITPDGRIIPAPESVEAQHQVQALDREMSVLRSRVSAIEGRLMR